MPHRDTTTGIPDAAEIEAEYARRSTRLGQMRDELKSLRAPTPAEAAPTVMASGDQALRQQLRMLAGVVEKLVEREERDQSSLGEVIARLQEQPPGAQDAHLRDLQRLEVSRLKNQIAPVRWPLFIAIVLFGATMFLANVLLMGLMAADILGRTS